MQRGLDHSCTESLKEILTCAHGEDAREHLKPIEVRQTFKERWLGPESLIFNNAQFEAGGQNVFAKCWKDPAVNNHSKDLVHCVSNRARFP